MNAGQCSRKTCLQNKAFFLAFSCYFFSDRNNLIEKRHKLVEIHLQLSPPFQRLLLSFWQLIIADIQRTIGKLKLSNIVLTSSGCSQSRAAALSFGNGQSGFFFAIKLSLWMKYQRYFLTLVFRQTLTG